MPKIETIGAWLFHFYSAEEDRPHVHIRNKAGKSAEIWLEPDIVVAANYGVRAIDLRKLVRIVEKNKTKYLEAWHEHFDS